MFAPHQPPPLPSLGWRWRQLKFTIVIKLLLCLRVFYLEWIQTAKYTRHCLQSAHPQPGLGTQSCLGVTIVCTLGRAAAGGGSTAPRGPGTQLL